LGRHVRSATTEPSSPPARLARISSSNRAQPAGTSREIQPGKTTPDPKTPLDVIPLGVNVGAEGAWVVTAVHLSLDQLRFLSTSLCMARLTQGVHP
jgi:hypothetical protein